MNDGNLVDVQNVWKTFRTKHFLALDEETRKRRLYKKNTVHAAYGISFSIARGEVFGLLGPNGAGKTTTVKMISGLVRPDSGGVFVDGLNVDKQRKKVLSKVGVVLEGTRTSIWPLTPLENLVYYGNLKNVTGKILRDRAHELLDFIGLREKKNVQVRRLSRGQKQKLAICISLIADPEVILLDEPTTGLDVQSSRAIKDKVLEMTRQFGKAALVTTHDMHVAQELCGRIGIIDKGKLVTCKPTEELLEVFSDQVYVFKLDREPGDAFLQDLPRSVGAATESSEDGPLLVATLEPEYGKRSEALYGIIEQLRLGGYELRGISQRQQNLETVFLKLTTSSI